MTLAKYKEKRDFRVTPEPAGKSSTGGIAKGVAKAGLRYVIQKHRATQLHYDFRLELGGVMLSWAVPKGPSPDPAVKRLAMHVEDHPVEYADFEGVIPEGEYGGGTVMVWDTGTWEPEQEDAAAAFQKGDLKFTLHGKKLEGSWVLVRTRGFGSRADNSWLLIKHRDAHASQTDVTAEMPRSAVSGRLLGEIARDAGGDVAKAATGDPAPPKSPRTTPAKRGATSRVTSRATPRRKR